MATSVQTNLGTEDTVAKAFMARVNRSRGRVAIRFRRNNRRNEWTWDDYYGRVRLTGLGLIELGVSRSARIALMSQTRPEWACMDLANMCIGAITVPIYPNAAPDEIIYILNHSEAQVLVVENQKLLNRVLPILQKPDETHVKTVICLEHATSNSPIHFNLMDLEELKSLGSQRRGEDFEDRIKAGTFEEHVTYNYTSGTTGVPKGVILTNKMILAELDAVYKNFRNELAEDDEILSFLPQSHIFGKLEYLFGLRFGWVQNYAQSLDTLISDIAEVRPTFMLAVPRVYEKFYAKLLSHREALAPTKRKLFDWALGIGIQVVQHQERHEAVPIFLKAQKKIADKIIFDKVRVQRFGGRLKFFISGGAPLSVDIARFFAASSLTILEGYGLTETSAAACVNPPHFNKPGTVGRPLPGVEVKIAPEDGEILMRGDIVTPGYYRNEAATKDAFRDGWFCSGDIGEIDADGFVKITDRKKDLIITAGGKNVAPQKIENKIKENPLVSSVLVYGDRKKYLVALITLNPDNARDYLKNHGSPDATGELHQQPAIRQNLDQWIEQVNSQLGNYETIKKFTILGQDFSVETGELTASLKVKRKVCNAKFHDILEGMYA